MANGTLILTGSKICGFNKKSPALRVSFPPLVLHFSACPNSAFPLNPYEIILLNPVEVLGEQNLPCRKDLRPHGALHACGLLSVLSGGKPPEKASFSSIKRHTERVKW